jgi:hypothetical protein
MNQDLREYVEKMLPREDEKELFRDLIEAYYRGGPTEVKSSIIEMIRDISGV